MHLADVVGAEGGIYPTVMTHAGLVVQPPRLGVRAFVLASYVGVRRPSDTNILLNGGAYTLPAYVLLDAGVSTKPLALFGKDGTVSFLDFGLVKRWASGELESLVPLIDPLLDRLVGEARQAGWADPAAVRSVVGSVDLPADDPDLQQADAYIRGLFAESAAQPILVRERGPRARPGKRSRG